MNRVILFFMALLGAGMATAQGKLPVVYQIKSDTARTFFQIPDSCWQMLEDPTGKLTIIQVTAPQYNAKFHSGNSSSGVYDRHTTHYWLRYTLKNTLSHDVRLYLDERVAYADLYFRKPGGNWTAEITGMMVPHELRGGFVRLQGFMITLAAGEEITFYEKDVFDFWLDDVPRSLSLTAGFADAVISSSYAESDRSYITAFIDATLFGLVLMAVVVNLLFYRVVKERLYLYFALYLFCMNSYLLINTTGTEYFIFNGHLYLYKIARALFFPGFFFFLAQFVRVYLRLEVLNPKLNTSLKVLSWFTTVLLLVDFLLPATIFDAIRLFDEIVSYLYFPILLGIILYGFRKSHQARTGIIAILPIMLWQGPVYTYLFICQLLAERYHRPYPSLSNILFSWNAVVTILSFFWLVVIFSWILFKRYSDLQKSLVQASLDREIERNLLIARQNEELEKQVELRTAELSQSLQHLKVTQTQLIQSEKMASLGELTAGIAHEIQNPLNFVNNFSEVNREMLDELRTELQAGNIQEALAIADDLQQNEEKITHHGKRADGIVKGMLQHSHASSGAKEFTDINALTDEYLRLAYHGLRAKDKSFNTGLITHFGPELPSVEVIPQDIGRVLLNLLNNAFYAVQQKQKTEGADYQPVVEVSTLSNDKRVVVRIRDNGTGIPDNIKDKILQPFFTTKPTGEGTGLGLSLSYDILVKGHGGNIDIESKEGIYTQFTISLPV